MSETAPSSYREHGADNEIDADGLHWPGEDSQEGMNARHVHDLAISIVEAYDAEHRNTYASRLLFLSLASRLKMKLPVGVLNQLLQDAMVHG